MKPITKAILLVGGKGTRLMPLTTTTPKPMLKLAGAPVTEHQIIKARDFGIEEIVLATSYLAEVFEPYFGDGSRFGISIKYAVEKEPLGTGGAIANAIRELDLNPDDSLVIFNGDVLSSHNLFAQAKLHEASDADVTLHLVRVEDARAYGCVPISPDGRVLDFLEKMEHPVTNKINAGCYIFKASALQEIPVGVVSSLEREIFPQMLQSGKSLYGFEDSSYWVDIGTPQALIRASRDLILTPALSAATPLPHSSRLSAHDGEALIMAGAVIDEEALVGMGSYVESGAEIGANSRVMGSIVGENAHIESDTVISDSYIAPESRVKSGSRIEGEIFGFRLN